MFDTLIAFLSAAQDALIHLLWIRFFLFLTGKKENGLE